MKKNIANFETFIIEQKAWFEENLAADFAESWDSFVWICGIKGSGWLRGNGANLLRFDEVNRLKGIDDRHTVSEPYQFHESDAGTRLSREKSQYFLCGCCRNADYFETMVLRSH